MYRECDAGTTLRRIIHFELDRMRRVLEADDLGHLQIDVAVDEVIVENAARFEEGAVLVQISERLAQRAAHGGDLLELRRRQIVQILVDRGAWIELVLDAVQSRQQHGGESQIGIAERIWKANLDASAIRRGGERDSTRGR